MCLLAFLLLSWGEGNAAEPHPVQARLLADVDTVVPGEGFRVGIALRMAEGWHTYWRFGGDAGLPTQVEWELPAGFAAGELEWPLPHKYEEVGGLIAYGYGGETMLLARMTAPDVVEGKRARIGAEVSWLVCRELCIPGDTTLVLELPVGEKAGEVNPDLFERYADELPGPLEEGVLVDYGVRHVGDGVRVDIALDGRIEVDEESPDFFPYAGEEYEFKGERKGKRLELTLTPYSEGEIERLEGVLVYRRAGDAERRAGVTTLELKGRGPLEEKVGLLEMDFSSADGGAERSLWLYLLLAAVGGLILNLMPCVLPVISLKVFSFVSQAGEERGRIRQLGFAFAAGIVAAFLALAAAVVLIKAGGEQIGWGFQFQHPGFVAGMAGLVFALGLSLFGVFTVNVTGGSLGKAGGGEGLAGSFFNGVLATILATPCTAPFLGTALGFAFAQSAGIVWSIFAAIGLGMALPYILLALEPGWMRFLPRPGIWMEQFKQLMGFLLMGTVLWLLWVLGKQIGMEGVIWAGAFLLCLAVGCWLIGQWIDLSSGRGRKIAVWGIALAIGVGGYLIFLEPVLKVEEALSGERAVEGGLLWEPFSVEKVEELLAEGRPVFIDFTAEWCWTCKVNERTVLTDARVRQRFAEMEVALVKADWTNRNPEITAMLRAFGRSGVPLYVIFPAGRAEEPLVLPEVITPGILLDKLEEAGAQSRAD